MTTQPHFIIDVTESPYNADPTGATDASAAIAAAAAAGPILLPSGAAFKISSDLDISAQSLTVAPGASFSIDAGKTLTVAMHRMTALSDTQIFAGAGSVVLNNATERSAEVTSTWFGGSASDWAPGIDRALASGARIVNVPAAAGTLASQINVPNNAYGVTVNFNGSTTFVAPFLQPVFGFNRTPAPNQGTILTIDLKGGLMVENGGGQTSMFCDFFGSALSAGVTIVSSGTTATVTAPALHGLMTGDSVEVLGATPADYNGIYVVVVTSPTTFTYTLASPIGSPASGPISISGLETAVFHDNKLMIQNGEFRGFYRLCRTRYTSLALTNLTTRSMGITWEGGRDTSFVTVTDYLGSDNGAEIF